VYASDLFVLPSRAEAFPLVLLEAMILKTPMIGSNVDGVPEMIKDGTTGYLFESENKADLVRAFEKMYHSKEDRNQYAEQASKKYWDNFSKEQFTRRYASLIEQVLKD
jgi:glycosyltransferase involved in cell wall biosynthesis